MSRKRGHMMAPARKLTPTTPAGLPSRVDEYVALCQCGWTYRAYLRVVVDERRALHVHQSIPVKTPSTTWNCPCGTGFNTRKDREYHMLECSKAPEGWTS